MEELTVAMIGTGDPSDPGPDGYGMAYAHGRGYQRVEGCELVACADLVEPNAAAFAREFDVPADHVFTDASRMVEVIDPDIVSVCTPVPTHEPLVVETAHTGESVRAIHCEKPMADTWGGARRMAAVTEEEGVQLTFNHQRRFGRPFRLARKLVDEGEIGELQRIEFGGPNIFDYGTHSVDLANYLVGEIDPRWVLANVDTRDTELWFDAPNENQAVVLWEYEDGVFGLASTGDGTDVVPCHHRLLGTDGQIEIGAPGAVLRLRGREDADWRTIDTDGEDLHEPEYIDRAIAEVIDSVRNGEPSELGAENALRATKIIFGGFESARRTARVEFPLEIADNPLRSLLDGEAA